MARRRRRRRQLELGAFIGGAENPRGAPLSIADAEERLFGLVLLNDWSARDIQARRSRAAGYRSSSASSLANPAPIVVGGGAAIGGGGRPTVGRREARGGSMGEGGGGTPRSSLARTGARRTDDGAATPNARHGGEETERGSWFPSCATAPGMGVRAARPVRRQELRLDHLAVGRDVRRARALCVRDVGGRADRARAARVPLSRACGGRLARPLLSGVGPFGRRVLTRRKQTTHRWSPLDRRYLRDPAYGSYDIALEVALRTPPADGADDGVRSVVSRSNFRHLYWNMKQCLVHHAVTGCNMRAGDLLGE